MRTLAKTAVHAFTAIGLAGAAITPAFAEEFERNSLSVSYADIDLDTAQGQKTLEKRIEKAARNVCRTTKLDTGTRIMSRDAANCLAKARADARQQVAALMANGQRGG